MRLKELLPSQRNGAVGRVHIDLPMQAVLNEIVNRRRRKMLLVLEQQSALTVKELSAHVWEFERSRRDQVPEKRSVEVSVKQNHIPRFVDAELIVSVDGPIHLTDRGESLADIVRLLEGRTTKGDYS